MSQILLVAFGIPAPVAPLAWFKGSDFDATTDGTDVAAWNDSSGNGFNTTAVGSAGDRPTVARNAINTNMTAVQGVTTKNGLIKSSGFAFTDHNTYSVSLVIKFAANAGSGTLNSFLVTDDGFNTGVRMGLDENGKFRLTVTNVGNWISNETITTAAWHYIVIVNTAGTVTVRVDGSALTFSSTAGSDSNPPETAFTLFRNSSVVKPDAKMAEERIFNLALNAAQITVEENYLKSRFGL